MNLNSEAIKKNDVEIAINNVSVVFKDNQGNDVKALDNIDFDIHKENSFHFSVRRDAVKQLSFVQSPICLNPLRAMSE